MMEGLQRGSADLESCEQTTEDSQEIKFVIMSVIIRSFQIKTSKLNCITRVVQALIRPFC